MKANSLWTILLLSLVLPGCLATRAELRGETDARRTQVSAAQERQAVQSTRFDDYDQQFRQMNGRMDQVENQLTQINAGHADKSNQEQKRRDEIEKRLRAYEEALNKLEAKVAELREELKASQKPVKKESVPAGGLGSSLTAAEAAFELKDWKLAIVEYENYRKENPKGKSYVLATYRIGLAFQELGKKEEAKVFFEEVVAKFPQSKEAKKASQKLKSMK
ncbi:MAG: tetratricopeptide repeat protein [Bdellovibrionales bacterium]